MANEAEARMIAAAFQVIKNDAGIQAQFPVAIRLTEQMNTLLAFGPKSLIVAGFPVKPTDYPSRSEVIYVDIHLCPVYIYELQNDDSPLIITNFFNYVRCLLSSNLPLKDTGGNVSDEFVDLSWTQTLYPASKNSRIPIFVARYQARIDVTTGEFR